MDENLYSKKGSLIKAQQAPGKEPCAPPTQDIARMSRSTTYIALHQTIFSSFKPLAHFFDSTEAENTDERGGEGALHPSSAAADAPGETKLLDSAYIARLGEEHLADEPSRELFKAHYRRFSDYLLQHWPSMEHQFSSSRHDEGFSQTHQYDFFTPPRAGPYGSSLAWPDPLKESLFTLFRRIISPWLESKAVEPGGSSITLAPESGTYRYLSTLPDHPWIAPRPVALLSDYEEIEETRLNDHQIRYVLRPYDRKLDTIEVLFDQARNIFTVQASPRVTGTAARCIRRSSSMPIQGTRQGYTLSMPTRAFRSWKSKTTIRQETS